MINRVLDHPRYEPGELLGSGAQGVVVRVRDREAPQRELVAKLWRAGVFSEALLEGEFSLLSRLRIPGLVRAHDLGRDRATGAPFFVEDFVPGPDARELVARAAGRERSDRLARLLADIAETLSALHDAGFVHGDLKPAHVRVPDDGRARLLDLGAAVARANASAVAITPGYAAPELLAGASPSPKTDLFGLGALAWAAAAGTPPPRAARGLRELAPWLLPGLEDLIVALLAEHPEDRPAGAREVLSALAAALPPGALAASSARREAAGSTLRAHELARLSAPSPGVRYIVGPPGSGKSHLARELVTRALLAGRDVRLLRFPCDDPDLVLRLVAYLRGEEAAQPFRGAAREPLLVVLDELELAPDELPAALEAYRCRPEARLDLVAAMRRAPEDAAPIALEPLPDARLAALCRELGESDARRIAELSAASGGNPGWIAAALAGVPLTREAVLERGSRLSPAAQTLLAALALAGGPLAQEICAALEPDAAAALAELSAARLVLRRSSPDGAPIYELAQPALRADLADALGSFELVDALASTLLDADLGVRSATLLSVASASNPPSRRSELLRRAAMRARAEGLRSEETEALLALAADPRERSSEVLLALDRVTRGGGSAGLHPEIVGWLTAAAERDPSLAVLALRRRGEQAARRGEMALARELADGALTAAQAVGDPESVALALSTQGAIALYRADWAVADEALSRAHATIASGAVDDPEEVARLLHNRGVVALYKSRLDEALDAFRRSLESKRRMGDRAGVWACLLNLGLSLSQAGRFDEAERALEEALALTRSLGQRSGGGWCLAALADAAVRRGDARGAERRLAEAEHLGQELPAAVRADLGILRAEIALLEGDGSAALAALAALDPEARAGDTLIEVRALVVEGRAWLARLPADRRRAARLAIRAIRRARSSGLPEPERTARDLLGAARGRSNRRAGATPGSYDPGVTPAEVWSWLEQVAAGAAQPAAATSLARAVVQTSGAERVFVALARESGEIVAAWGVDLDGLEIADAARRIPADAVESALHRGEPVYQREVESAAGSGSRLAVAASAAGPQRARALVVAEHRFATGRFDAVRAEDARRWALLAALLARLSAETVAERSAETSELASHSVSRGLEPSTVLPARARTRQFPAIVGQSPAIERALVRLDAAVDSELPVLIVGETGVGKELFARALHEHGPRARAAFVAVSCGAIPDSLFEAELFGHVRGSFTGADRKRPGLLARAQGGTLFLDEIGELPLVRQATLLRALATRSYRPVGSDEERPFDVRIVAATNRDLERAVADGSFRQDLLYRLNVLEITVPPLREREGDVARIARHVLERAGSRAELSPAARLALEAHDWPGNVRELEHQLQRLAALGVPRIELAHLSREVRGAPNRPARRKSGRKRSAARSELGPERERAEVLAALDAAGGNITRAAERLGLTRHGLKKKLVRLGLRASAASQRESG
jgi:serine/threonine-protein kinase PknK